MCKQRHVVEWRNCLSIGKSRNGSSQQWQPLDSTAWISTNSPAWWWKALCSSVWKLETRLCLSNEETRTQFESSASSSVSGAQRGTKKTNKGELDGKNKRSYPSLLPKRFWNVWIRHRLLDASRKYHRANIWLNGWHASRECFENVDAVYSRWMLRF